MSKQVPKLEITANEVIHSGPMGCLQHYDRYTEADQETWKLLYKRQIQNLEDKAYSVWLEAMEKIGLSAERIPKFVDLAAKLKPLTGWVPVGVTGLLPGSDYFLYLSERQFPTAPHLRPRSQMDFIDSPDLFHDAFGHLPMHSHQLLSDFVAIYGKMARLVTDKEQRTQLGRLYWFTVEYGLIEENGQIKVAGAGHLSGFEEAGFSLSNKVKRRPFDVVKVCNQDFSPHVLQPVLFIMESFEQLMEALAIKAKEFEIDLKSVSLT